VSFDLFYSTLKMGAEVRIGVPCDKGIFVHQNFDKGMAFGACSESLWGYNFILRQQ